MTSGPPRTPSDVLRTLTTTRLGELCRSARIEVDGPRKSDYVAALAEDADDFAAALGRLSPDELRAVCRHCGFEIRGRTKADLVASITGALRPASGRRKPRKGAQAPEKDRLAALLAMPVRDALRRFEQLYYSDLIARHDTRAEAALAAGMTLEGLRVALLRLDLAGRRRR
jgi:hypothetical protein